MNATLTLKGRAVLLVLTFVAQACIEPGTTHGETACAGTSAAGTVAEIDRQNTDFPVVSDPRPLTPLMQRELRGCFDFFWNEWISDPNSPTYGMTSGDDVGLGRYSPIPIESQGFYFAVIVIGVERGWITRQEGRADIGFHTGRGEGGCNTHSLWHGHRQRRGLSGRNRI